MDKNRLQKSVTWDNCSQIDTRGSNLLPQFRDQSEIQTNLYFFILQLGNLLFLQPDHTMTMVDFVEVMWLSKITPYHFGFSRWVDLLNATSLVALVGSTQVKIKLLAKEQNAALESFKANASKLLQSNSPLTLNTFGEVYCKEFAFPFHKKLCEKTLSYVLNFVPSSNIVLTKSGYILKNIPELKSGISNVRSKWKSMGTQIPPQISCTSIIWLVCDKPFLSQFPWSCGFWIHVRIRSYEEYQIRFVFANLNKFNMINFYQ